MSQAIFPTLNGLTFDVTKTPQFRTLLVEAASGRERRAFLRQYPRYKLKLKYEYIKDKDNVATVTELDQILGFFNQMKGQYDSFKLLDSEDNAATGIGVPNNIIALGDGVTTGFQIGRVKGGAFDPIYDINANQPAPNIYIENAAATVVNLLKYSQDITQAAAWVAANGGTGTSPIVAGAFSMAPDNTLTAGRISFPAVGAGGTNFSGLKQATGALGAIASRTFTFSVWLRCDVPSPVTLVLEDANAGQQQITVVTVTAQWQRFTITKTFAASAQTALNVHFRNPGGSPAGTVCVWGSQLEEAAAATSYMKTQANAWGRLLKTLTTDYTISSTGFITFVAAPASGVMIAADLSFYWRCRFLDDEQDLDQFLDKLYSGEVDLITVKP